MGRGLWTRRPPIRGSNLPLVGRGLRTRRPFYDEKTRFSHCPLPGILPTFFSPNVNSKTLIFVPTYNERDNAPRMAGELAALGLDADLLFVDDNSSDGTGQLLDALRPEIPRLTVRHRAGKLGIGSAHSEAISWAYDQGYQVLVSLDCDFTHSPSDIPEMLLLARGHDVVVGSRWTRRNSLPGWNLFRRIITTLGHLLTRSLLAVSQDASGAFRAYRLDRIPRALFGLIQSQGYSFFFESLFIMSKNGLSIAELPITLPARTYGSSKMTTQAAIRSACYVFELAAANIQRPERFLLPGTTPELDPSLHDPQDWDTYWAHAGDSANPIYGTIAGIYRRAVIKRHLERAIRREFPRGASLLHAGCGGGQVDSTLQNEMRITALDISPGALALYSRNNRAAHAIRHGSIFSLPFADSSFDGVYNLGVMEHFTPAEIKTILVEFRRVLKPGEKVVLLWPHALATSVFVLRACGFLLRTLRKSSVQFHPAEITHIRSRQHAAEILESSGLSLADYRFGASDFWVQAVVVGRRGKS